VVHLRQDYRSVAINDLGKKTLYLRRNDNYEWKIMGELWDKMESEKVPFAAMDRYFL
jgi:hypothetical protein